MGRVHQDYTQEVPLTPPRSPQAPRPLEELLEDDEDGVTGVVNVAHQNANALTKDVDAQREKLNSRMHTLREKLSNSGPLARRPRKKEPTAAR